MSDFFLGAGSVPAASNGPEDNSSVTVPSYLVAAKTHEEANDYSLAQSAGYGSIATLASAGTQLFNILPTIGNWLGGDYEQAKTSETLQSFDEDISKYYSSHQGGIDTLGFVLSSFVPGSAGVKVFNAGTKVMRGAAEAGAFGSFVGKGFGLLAPMETKLLPAAIESALAPNAGFALMNANTVKALVSGAGSAALEGAAFELAISATMYNSPTLKDKDFGDLASNVMHSAAMFGVIGGVARAAGTFSKIKSAGRAVDKEATPWSFALEPATNASVSDKILSHLDDYQGTPKVPTAEEYAATAGLSRQQVAEQQWKLNKFESLRADKMTHIETKVRGLVGELVGAGDKELADTLYSQLISRDLSWAENKFWKAEEFKRLGTTSQRELELRRLAKQGDDLVLAADDKLFSYIKLAGEDAGKVTPNMPQLLHIADTVKAGETYMQALARHVTKFEEGFNGLKVKPMQAEARYVSAAKAGDLSGKTIAEGDLPYLQAAYNTGAREVKIKLADGSIWQPQSREELLQHLIEKKGEIAAKLIGRKGEAGVSYAEASKIVDLPESMLYGEVRGLEAEAWAGTIKTGTEMSKPQWAKIVTDCKEVVDVDGNLVKGLAAIKVQQRAYEQATDHVLAANIGEDAAKFTRISDAMTLKANRVGTGGSFISAQNENYGTLGSLVQELGLQTIKLVEKWQKATRETFTPALHKLMNNQEAAIEFSVINSKLRGIPEAFGYDAATQSMRPLVFIKYERALMEGLEVEAPLLKEGVPLSIPIKNAEAASLIEQHIAKNGSRTDQISNIRANQGVAFRRDSEAYYAIPPNLKDYPHFAHVIDDSVSGLGHSKMIYAANPLELEAKITAIKQTDPALTILTKGDAEAWYKAVGKYDFERTLTDSHFDAAAARTGTSENYLVATDPRKIVDDFLSWHLERDAALVRENVSHLNETAFNNLRSMGDSFAKIGESHFTSMDTLKYIEAQVNNPYANYIKTALGMRTISDFPIWTPINQLLDKKVSSLFGMIGEAWNGAKTVGDLDHINKMLMNSGYQGAAYSSMTAVLANSSISKGVATSFVSKANALMATFQLRLDPINALNNWVGSHVLLATELKAVQRAIGSGNEAAVGELASLLSLKVPGTDQVMGSATKLIGESMSRYHGNKELLQQFKDRGIISSISDQYHWVLDNLAISGKETAAQLDSKLQTVFTKLKSAGDAGERLTGNRFAEEFNRFVAADVMKRITDVAVKAGKMGEEEAWSYINTFVNRTQGNYLAAQRPGVFQGPIGQAIGLFQTYQFNLAQQLLRHVGEGSMKDAALMMGLQSTIFGIKGAPAFDAINTHILGTASGNNEHRDTYSTVFGAFGKDAGQWLMYGAASNALGLIHPDAKLNLYSRGDINPRNVTVLPMNPANVPFVQGAGKLFGSMYETFGKIKNGGNVYGSLLQGIEHAGLNRPLQGLAQAMEAYGNPKGISYSTSNKGNIVAANDFWTGANAVRILGAKPLDEAMALDGMYQQQAYSRYDTERRNKLGETVKTKLMAGNRLEQSDVDGFAKAYAATGGQQSKFGQWILQQYKYANESQINSMAHKLSSPVSQGMQRMLGGYDIRDGLNSKLPPEQG